MLIIVQMYNTRVDCYPDCRVLRLDTKAQATRRTDTTELLGECEIESKLEEGKKKKSKLINTQIQLTLLANNS